MRIYWTDFSKAELQNIFHYYKEKASLRVAKELVLGIENKTKILTSYSEAGQIEELLSNRKQQFRYLVYKNYKIIYWVNNSENRVEISDVFDTRQNPVKLKNLSI